MRSAHPRPSPERGARPRAPRARRLLAATVAALALGSLLAVVPLPVLVVEAGAMETETRSPDLNEEPIPEAGRTASADDLSLRDASEMLEDEGPLHEEAAAVVAEAPDRRYMVETELDPFVLVGVTTQEESDEEMLVRVRVGDEWGHWFPLHDSEDHGPDPGSPEAERAGPQEGAPAPVWVGEADAYELSVAEGAPEVDVHLVREGETRVRVATNEEQAEGMPLIRTRSSWGARAPREAPREVQGLDLAVVHHTVNANSYPSSQVPAMLRAVQAFHMDANGWDDIGYNFLVDRFGRVWEGRSGGVYRSIVGGHSRGFNTRSTGVAVLGEFQTATPPTAVVTAIGDLLAWKFAVHATSPSGTTAYTTTTGSTSHPPGTYVLPRIIGHRDVSLTACPGSLLHSRLSTIRNRAVLRYPGLLRTYSPVLRKHQSLGGTRGYLGPVTEAERLVRGNRPGRVARYRSGDIYWSSRTGAHPVWGRLLTEYRKQGGVGGTLGYPTSDILTTPDHRAKYSIFQYGRIYSMQSTSGPAVTVTDPFHAKHAQMGGVRGFMGHATANARTIQTPRGGLVQLFEKGRMFRVDGTTYQTHGSLDAHHQANGGIGGAFGYPTSDVINAADGNGRTQRFQQGQIWSLPAAGLNGRGLHGVTLERYLAGGDVRGELGYPILGTTGVGDGRGTRAEFQRGHLYGTPPLGAFGVHGPVLAFYLAQGGPTGSLGYPTGELDPSSQAGDRYQSFENGRMALRADGSVEWAPGG